MCIVSTKNERVTLYHYCNFEAFKKIVSNKRIKFGNVRNSNDYDEIVYLYRSFAEKNLKNNNAKISYDFFCKQDLGYKGYYTLSLSENRDDLNMWRGYAQYNGICIGFNKKALEEYTEKIQVLQQKAQLVKVKYLNKEEIKEESTKILLSLENNDRNIIGELEAISNITCEYKNKGFESEKEWRIYFSNFNKDPNHYLANENEHRLPEVLFNSNHVQYSSDDFYLIPFEFSMIDEVIIGPKSLITKNDVISLLESYNHDHTWKEKVSKTSLTYK